MADELLNLLDIAIDSLANLEDTGWSSYNRREDFVADLRALRSGVANNDRVSIQRLRLIFAPTGDWDDCVGPGEAAGKLANDLSELLEKKAAKLSPT